MDRMIKDFLSRKPEKFLVVYHENIPQQEAEHPELTIKEKARKDLAEIARIMSYGTERAMESLSEMAARLDREAMELEMVSGLSVKQVTAFLRAGYTLKRPEPVQKMECCFAEFEADRILNGNGAEYEQHVMRRFVKAE